jgi:uncharacterized alpha-E superfamily protein
MIARVAQACFWLHRYVERAESTARLLQVSQHVSLDLDLDEAQLWRPVLDVAGEEALFAELHGPGLDGDAVQDFLAWDERNPVSIVSSLRRARDNARTIRETISLEMWQALNSLWLWVTSREGRRLYERERHLFYERVKAGCELFHGLFHTTMLFDEPYDFMRLGSLLERAEQTIRLLDATWRATAVPSRRAPRPTDAPRWLAALRALTGVEAFTKRTRGTLVGPVVAAFLLYDDRFPRAVHHCMLRASLFIDRARGGEASEAGAQSAALLAALRARLRAGDIDAVIARGLPQELAELTAAMRHLGAVIQDELFDVTAALPGGA